MIEFACDCQMKKHRAPLEGCEISSGAIYKLPEILKDYNRIYLVADENTYRAAGALCEKVLRDASKFSHKLILDGEVDDIPEQAFLNVGTIEEAISKGEKILAAIQA